jgi:hypothetical protein
MTMPISPKDLKSKKPVIPPQIIEAASELIAERWDGYEATFTLHDLGQSARAKLGMHQNDTFEDGHLNIEPIFHKSGWIVSCDRPDYTEFNPRFRLRKKAMTTDNMPSNQEHPPTYQELADLVCELVETNIANLDGKYPFVSCFTFSSGEAPDHWHRAVAAREALIASKLVPRQRREIDNKKIRSLRG